MKTKVISLCLLASGLTMLSNIVWAGKDSNVGVDITYTSDDNLNNSPDDSFTVDDVSTTASAAYHFNKKLDHTSQMVLGITGSYTLFQEIDGLDHAAIKFSAAYRIKPNSGFGKPVYSLFAELINLDSKTDIRDRVIFKAGGSMSAKITTTLSARTGLSATKAESESRVFDITKSRFFINADLLLSKSLTTYLTYSYIAGDSVSTLSSIDPIILEVAKLTNIILPDPAFGSNQIAYNLDTKTSVISLGFNYSIARKQALDISVRMITSDASNGIGYDRQQLTFSYLVSF